VLCSSISSTRQCSYTRVCRSQITSWIFGKHFYRSPFMVIVFASFTNTKALSTISDSLQAKEVST
jgi:hypothetical protein